MLIPRPIVVLVSFALAVIGASSPSVAGQDTERDATPTVRRLRPGDADVDGFGTAVAVHGRRVVVGALRSFARRESQPGAAFVFERTQRGTWKRVARLGDDESAPDDRYGQSVAIQGGRVAVGAPRTDGAGSNSGAVYIYRLIRRTGEWTLEATLRPGDAADHVAWGAGHQFGSTVAFIRGGLAVGAPGDNVWTGAVYVYERKGREWSEAAKLTAAEGREEDTLGNALAAHRRTIVAGAQHVQDVGSRSGAAYIFEYVDGDWHQVARLTASDNQQLINFGWSVAVRGDLVAVGAPGAGGLGDRSGAAYVFRRTESGWLEESRVLRSDVMPYGRLGSAISIGGGKVIVGAPAHRSEDGRLGIAFVYSGPPWRGSPLRAGGLSNRSSFGGAIAYRAATTIVGASGASRVYVFE